MVVFLNGKALDEPYVRLPVAAMPSRPADDFRRPVCH
jgi:hypothetical protein